MGFLHAWPCVSTALLLLVCFLLSCSLLKPCTSAPFDKVPGFLHLNSSPSSCSGWDKVSGDLTSYINTYYYHTNPDDPGFFLTFNSMLINGSSFSILFTVSRIIYDQQSNSVSSSKPPYSSLFFSIQPALDPEFYEFYPFALFDRYNISPLSDTSAVFNVSGGGGNLSATIYEAQRGVWVQIRVEQVPATDGGSSGYSVWIDYHHVDNSVWVYVDTGSEAAASNKPAYAAANATLGSPCVMPEAASLGFRSSVGQLEQLHTLNTTIIGLDVDGNDTAASTTWADGNDNDTAALNSTAADWPQPECYPNSASLYAPRGREKKTIIILSSVLGSAAGTAAISAAVACFCFNSRQRRWRKEQDKLTKVMQSLPGVPAQVDFADIRRATNNFHETMKLGRGGFGAVYRCTLPVTASSRITGQLAMEVAVKKFVRGVDQDRRYNDFLAEVSIINRLRHKNIVPLVGWSYNKGEPLLVYEYMTNGSLDQHLFERGTTTTATGRQRLHQQLPHVSTNPDIFRWDTRYGIVRDIATGLHYVHNEHEPMVLHRDIKASNIMLDSNFRARLGDFGIACTVAIDRTSATGIAGTFGYMAPEYVITCRATRQTDIYAFGVLILEIVTGHKNGVVPGDESHITLWVRRLHREGKLLETVDDNLLFPSGGGHDQLDNVVDEAKRLLLLGLACTNPNFSGRPTMAEVVQVINKLAPPPNVSLEAPMLFGLHDEPEERPSSLDSDDYGITVTATTEGSSTTRSIVELQVIQEQPMSAANGGRSDPLSIYSTSSHETRTGTS